MSIKWLPDSFKKNLKGKERNNALFIGITPNIKMNFWNATRSVFPICEQPTFFPNPPHMGAAVHSETHVLMTAFVMLW